MSLSFYNTMPTNLPTKPKATAGRNLMFPSDLITGERNFYTTIQFVEWTASQAISSILANSVLVDPRDGIILPLPRTINEQQTMVWEENKAIDSVPGLATNAKNVLDKTVERTQSQLNKISGTVGLALAGKTVAEYLTGATINPFLYMMFRSPTFKTHTLDWILAPKSEQESNNITKIINTFKKSSLPSTTLGAILHYPMIAMVRLNPDSHLLKFKPCAVTSVSVNYTAAGSPSFFKSGAPSVVSIQLQLKEIDIWTQNNYDGGTGGTGVKAFLDSIMG